MLRLMLNLACAFVTFLFLFLCSRSFYLLNSKQFVFLSYMFFFQQSTPNSSQYPAVYAINCLGNCSRRRTTINRVGSRSKSGGRRQRGVTSTARFKSTERSSSLQNINRRSSTRLNQMVFAWTRLLKGFTRTLIHCLVRMFLVASILFKSIVFLTLGLSYTLVCVLLVGHLAQYVLVVTLIAELLADVFGVLCEPQNFLLLRISADRLEFTYDFNVIKSSVRRRTMRMWTRVAALCDAVIGTSLTFGDALETVFCRTCNTFSNVVHVPLNFLGCHMIYHINDLIIGCTCLNLYYISYYFDVGLLRDAALPTIAFQIICCLLAFVFFFHLLLFIFLASSVLSSPHLRLLRRIEFTILLAYLYLPAFYGSASRICYTETADVDRFVFNMVEINEFSRNGDPQAVIKRGDCDVLSALHDRTGVCHRLAARSGSVQDGVRVSIIHYVIHVCIFMIMFVAQAFSVLIYVAVVAVCELCCDVRALAFQRIRQVR